MHWINFLPLALHCLRAVAPGLGRFFFFNIAYHEYCRSLQNLGFHQQESLAANTYPLSVPTDPVVSNYHVADASGIGGSLFDQWQIPTASGFEHSDYETLPGFPGHNGIDWWANDPQQPNKQLTYVEDGYQMMVNDVGVGSSGQGFMTNMFAEPPQHVANNFGFGDPALNASIGRGDWEAVNRFDPNIFAQDQRHTPMGNSFGIGIPAPVSSGLDSGFANGFAFYDPASINLEDNDNEDNDQGHQGIVGSFVAALPQPVPALPPLPVAALPVAVALPAAATTIIARIPCSQGCAITFSRDSDRVRHEQVKHGNRPLYLCEIPGCAKSVGTGYTRKDKLTEHMWKKHAALGYTKRM